MKRRMCINFWTSLTVSEIIDTIIAGDITVIKSFRNTINSVRFKPANHPNVMDAAKLVAEFKLYSNDVRLAYRDKKFKLTQPDSTV